MASQLLHQQIEQVPGAEAVACRDREGLAEAERVQLGRQRLVLRPIDLVGRHDHRATRATQQVGEVRIAGA
jgi:hypothetical protein